MIIKLFLVVFLFTFFAAVTNAQENPSQAVLNAQEQFFDIKKRSIELERVKREAGRRPVKNDFHLNFPKIKEDFEQIQKSNNDFFQIVAAQSPVNYAAVLKLVSEINQRADRLRSNLFSDESEEKKNSKNQPTVDESDDIKLLFTALDKAVNSFAHNPMFRNLNLVNLDDSLKAQKDLETVLTISLLIKDKAKKTMKNNSEN